MGSEVTDCSKFPDMIPFLGPSDPFPPVEQALDEPDGLLAAGADLSPRRLVAAYRQGIFPWFNDGDPILWWSPDPRVVLAPREFHVSHSLKKRLAQRRFTVTIDTSFAAVLDACAAPRLDDGGTWLTSPMKAAYVVMHQQGLAHSIEVWMDGALAGGVYGVALGRMFFGESMFSRRTDASKIALAYLSAQLARWGFPWIDCQLETDHLRSLGAVPMPRSEFVKEVARLVLEPAPDWQLHPDLGV